MHTHLHRLSHTPGHSRTLCKHLLLLAGWSDWRRFWRIDSASQLLSSSSSSSSASLQRLSSRKNRESKTNWWKLFACSLFFGHFVARFICAFLFAERFCSLLSHGYPFYLCFFSCLCALLAMLQKRSLNLLCVLRAFPVRSRLCPKFVSFRFVSFFICNNLACKRCLKSTTSVARYQLPSPPPLPALFKLCSWLSHLVYAKAQKKRCQLWQSFFSLEALSRIV